jgi:hypothetical protein
LHVFVGLSVFLIVFLDACYAYSYSGFEMSPDKKHKVVWECKEKSNTSSIYTTECKIFAINSNGNIVWINKESNSPEPTVKWYDNNLAEIKIPCGSPCKYSIFYDVNKGVSVPYEFVIAVDVGRRVVARAGKYHVLINNIFQNHDKNIKIINLDFAETAALILVIEKAYFTKKGNLYIRYLSGKNYSTKEKTIPVKIKQ